MRGIALAAIGVFVIYGCACVTLGGDPSDTSSNRPTSPAAELALERYDKAVKDADETHRQAILRATTILLDRLKPVRAGAMKTQNLVEATAIDNLMKRLDQQISGAAGASISPVIAGRRDAIARRLAGSRWAFGNLSSTMSFNDDGTTKRAGPDGFADGMWVPIDGQTVIVLYSNQVIDRLQFDDSVTTYEGTGYPPTNKFKGHLQPNK